ncbi:MAG TPA: hypothetical protein VGS96_20145 [Thermoanaerobaculia bacterium]|jgi:hypothetical protein|nr:hypothetical protein [Thermoanaerobaculia bacterium]
MKAVALFALASAISCAALAHPAVGIVVDSRGNIFYSDLHHVWRIAPDGSKSIAVPNVHTHELCLDGEDNLYGEHLWYEGEATNRWGHRVWKRTPDGRVVNVIPPTEGFLQNYSFVRDRAGNMYWVERATSEIRKRMTDGRIVTIARGKFRDARWMTVTPDGVVYMIDARDLLRTTNGRITTVARHLSSRHLTRPFVGEHHLLMGLWTDGGGNVYIADYVAGEVKRVSPDGRVAVIARSSLPWSPTGGVFDRHGSLWLLEYSVTNAVRVRRVY